MLLDYDQVTGSRADYNYYSYLDLSYLLNDSFFVRIIITRALVSCHPVDFKRGVLKWSIILPVTFVAHDQDNVLPLPKKIMFWAVRLVMEQFDYLPHISYLPPWRKSIA